MDRLIATNSVPFASADTAPATGTPQYGTSGNPATSTPATVWPAYAFNALQDEIYSVIVAAGLTPDRNAWNQLLTAIETMMQGSTTNVGVDTGAANAYVVAFAPALSEPVPWVPFWFKVKTANTGASTLNATGTVEPLVGAAHAALQGNEMVANGNALVYWNPTLASGAGSYVLLFCSGAPEQIAPGTQSEHAVQLGQVRIKLTANTTFYVSATGSNSNNGLTPGAPWLTLQYAYNYVQQNYDIAAFNVTFSVASGTYASVNAMGYLVGQGATSIVSFAGSGATISSSIANDFLIGASNGAVIQASGFTLTATGNGATSVFAGNGGQIRIGTGIVFGANTNGQHVSTQDGGTIYLGASYSITGGAEAHYSIIRSGVISVVGAVITLTGTPAFGSSFASIANSGVLSMTGNTFSGSATGVRYNISANGVVNTFGGGASYLPGSSSGTTASGGQYL